MATHHNTTMDILKVAVINLASISMTFTNVEWFLKFTALGLTIGYTIWKWVRDYNKHKK